MSAPFFVFKNINSLDMSCIIEEELPEITPEKREEVKQVTGRSGELTTTFGDYDSYDYTIEFTILDYEKLEEVKKWLRGSGQLITHNDLDKYRAVRVKSEPREYQNEWDEFWNVKVTFRCEPFRKQINEPLVALKKGANSIYNNGHENSFPLFKFKVLSGNVAIVMNNETFTILSPPANKEFVLDTENGICYADGVYIRTKGDFPMLLEGDNTINLTGNITFAEMDKRSVWL